ncbi:DHA2 family efflux MFS transporter permease subunit [Nakamurella antarctica]|uniref:DHA2 family efflux MFS transporter permease subunit n=1 Tax=Nakamurella antarctica TaxID=1902245 RepID=A0A3G8ZI31_9ACTN|nr:MFS transporter [Nakamurella antarctica]AZI56860.1 DHA2 family efflux MFS transporter permease subunit [Nakamurella antarctica]
MPKSTSTVEPKGSFVAGGAAPDPKRWIALIVIGVAQLMVVLDATITNIAMPRAAAELGIAQADLQWIITAYALPFGSLLLLGGRIADYVGRKKVMIIALSGFALASALGGAASQAWMLLAARGLQGVFAAALAPAALSMLTVTFTDAKERAKAFAVFGAIAGGGAAVGLLLGGVLTEYANWRWCLLVNIPIAIGAMFAAIAILRESKTESTGHYDVPGAVLATLGLAGLVWGFTRPEKVGWASLDTWSWIGGAVIVLALFVVWESRSTNPLLPIRILANRNRAAAYLVGMLVGAGMFSLFLFLTIYLQIVLQYTPVKAGFAFLPFSAGIVLGAGVGSQLVLKVGPRIVVTTGSTLGAIALFWMSSIAPDTTYVGTILPAMVVMAFGVGFIFMATTNIALVGISNNDAGVASAVVNTTQQVGGSLGIALLSTISSTTFLRYLTDRGVAPIADPYSAAIDPVQVAATLHGYGVAFKVAAGLFALAAVIAVTLISAKKSDLPTGAAVAMH